ncbi:uncharacterized protein LOC119362582 [Triticum dicoccoides]|uniref:uncharacterized protein LOC119362582 n=1 Tax=Triticum dicoccoides TaxID=85692 RepID=UPI00188F4CB1|nr:uncharacterized protein LOC119362582 [Triticum dicoccoides]
MQQWLVLCLRDLGCEWAAASRAYAPVAALAVRPSAEEEEEGDSVRRQGFFNGLRLEDVDPQEESQQDALQIDFEQEIGAPRASRQRSRFTEGCFFSLAAARAGELRAEEQQLAQEQARWELEDELEVEARRELQLQPLETQARAGPGRREGIAAAQALGSGRA